MTFNVTHSFMNCYVVTASHRVEENKNETSAENAKLFMGVKKLCLFKDASQKV